jgi:hypothetical protein
MLVAEYAILSRETYSVRDYGGSYNLPSGWIIHQIRSPRGTWGNCYVEFINHQKKEIVVSVRGTDDVLNVMSDIGLAFASIYEGMLFLPPGQVDLENFVERILYSESVQKHNYNIKIIGHSLGGAMAELAAVKFGIECISFESPGALHMMQQFPHEYLLEHFRFVTSYLSAPNIINTLNPHPGFIYRMHLPHAIQVHWWHVAECLVSALYTASSYLAISASPAILLCNVATKELLKNIAKNSFMAAIGTKVLKNIINWRDDMQWLGSQHSITNIAEFLLNDGMISKMDSWPIIWEHLNEKDNKLLTFARDCLPLQKDRPGIRNVFDENGMREAQVNRIRGYIVEYVADPNEELNSCSRLLKYRCN